MQAMAAKAVGTGKGASLDVRPWHELQNWLGEIDEFWVVIPYAEALAKAIPPVAVRLRRDFGALLGLIKTHAILHQYQRDPTFQEIFSLIEKTIRAHLFPFRRRR
jgi:hypothetical protein